MTDVTDEQIAAWEADDDYDYSLIFRIDKLEQLCRDLYENLEKWELPPNSYLTDRMCDLGLINETEYDPDTGQKWGEQ